MVIKEPGTLLHTSVVRKSSAFNAALAAVGVHTSFTWGDTGYTLFDRNSKNSPIVGIETWWTNMQTLPIMMCISIIGT